MCLVFREENKAERKYQHTKLSTLKKKKKKPSKICFPLILLESLKIKYDKLTILMIGEHPVFQFFNCAKENQKTQSDKNPFKHGRPPFCSLDKWSGLYMGKWTHPYRKTYGLGIRVLKDNRRWDHTSAMCHSSEIIMAKRSANADGNLIHSLWSLPEDSQIFHLMGKQF